MPAPQPSVRSWAIDLRAEVFDGAGRNLERTDRAQPALFAVEYALAKLIESYGVRAGALAGHSIGEYAAATFAGVFDLPTAVKAVSMRARLMHASARGVMVAVAAEPGGHRRTPLVGRRSRGDQRPRQLRGRGIRREHPQFPGPPRRERHRGPSGPDVARVPLAVDGSGDSPSSPPSCPA